MYKRSLFFIILIIIIAFLGQQLYLSNPKGKTVTIAQKYTKHILLVPLDSRPPCGKFVVDAGKMADIEVITPPQEIMDYYTQHGDTVKLQEWLRANAASADGIIISIDQLLYGGLLASREAQLKEDQEDSLWQTLQLLRQENPQLPIYAFNILPRITPPANIDAPQDIKHLMQYSRLIDKYSQSGEDEDRQKIVELQTSIDDAQLKQYMELYDRNLQLNEKLIDLTADGVLTKLVIGQDDGEKYGIPNIERRKLRNYAKALNEDSKVTITHGADEVAMSLLFNMTQAFASNAYRPKVYVAYNEAASMQAVLPYMAAPIADIVKEKIAMADGVIVMTPAEADYILYIHIGNAENLSTRFSGAEKINGWLKDNKKVAVVDLSKHFSAQEALFPIMVENDLPLNQLLAYSGWNTASNSIGTAVAQASLFCQTQANNTTSDDVLRLNIDNLTILYDHFVEDYFYLKGTIDAVNTTLRKAGINNVSDLNMDNNYFWANHMLILSLQKQLAKLSYSKSARSPLPVHTDAGEKNLYLRNLQVNASFPWPRTFEIYTDVNFTTYVDNGR